MHAKLHLVEVSLSALGRVDCGFLERSLASKLFIGFIFGVERPALVAFLVRFAQVVALLWLGCLIRVLVHALVASTCCILRLAFEFISDWVTPGAADGIDIVVRAPVLALIRFLQLFLTASLAGKFILDDRKLRNGCHALSVKAHGVGLCGEVSDDCKECC